MKLNFLLSVSLSAAALLGTAGASATTVKLTNIKSTPSFVSKESGKPVEMGALSGGACTFECDPGTYVFGIEGYGNIELEVLEPSAYADGTLTKTASQVRLVNSNGWKMPADFSIAESGMYVASAAGEKRVFTPVMNEDGISFIAFSGDAYTMTFTPSEARADYMPYIASGVTSTYTSTVRFSFAAGKDFTLTFPADATAELSFKKSQTHYIAFQGVEPVSSVTENGKTVNTYRIQNSSTQYAYKVRRGDDMTHGALFTAQSTDAIEVTDAEMKEHSRRYFDHEVKGKGTNYADIFLNINKRNLLRLKKDETFQIVNIRTWQITNNATSNLFVEPDYRYTVLNQDFKADDSVVEVSPDGVITAKAPGTAIVQVRYDAMSFGAMGGSLWSELWAENTGTFVVTVDADGASAPADNIRLDYKKDIEIDCEHDILYYMNGKKGYELTFTPAEGATVSVANPLVDTVGNNVTYPDGFSSENVTANADGSVTVLLTYGRNIVRTSDAAGNANYQVLSAKPITCDMNTGRTDSYVLPGDNVTAQFDGLFHVAGKLAGLYNSTCYLEYNGKPTGNAPMGTGQYDFAGNAKALAYPVTVPATGSDDVVLADGCLHVNGFGSGPGAHRGITYTAGINPNFNAGIATGTYGSLPAQTIKVTPLAGGMKLSTKVNVNETTTPVSKAALEAAFGTDYTWTSANPEIATVDQNGLVKGLKEGKTVITFAPAAEARAAEPIEIETAVAIVPLESIKLAWRSSLGNVTVKANGTYPSRKANATLTPSNATDKTLTWIIGNPEIISIAADGTVKPLAAGTTTVQAVGENGKVRSTVLEVEVRYEPASVAVDPAEATLGIGKSMKLTATIAPESSYVKDVEWTSSDPEVASVNEEGTVTAVAIGKATVTATVKGFATITAASAITVSDTGTGVESVESDSCASFWPNPCDDRLFVKTVAEGEVRILDLNGNTVMAAEVAEGVSCIDMTSVASGIYLIRIDGTTWKVIKK